MSDPSALRRLRRLDAGMGIAAAVALAAVIGEYGFLPSPPAVDRLRGLALAGVATFALLQASKLLVVGRPLAYLRTHRLDFALLFVLVVQGLAFAALSEAPEALWLARQGRPSPLLPFYVAVLQGYVVAVILARSPLMHLALVRIRLRPAQLLVASFAIVVAAGTFLLALPGASRDGVSIGALDALFTATSAVCVTGLVVRDTAAQFSTFGIAVIATLIQVGGLGILTFTASFALAGGRTFAPGERERLARALDPEADGNLRGVLRRVLAGTLVTEAVGAAVLYAVWRDVFPDPFVRFGQAVFHAISAFCNAGFALFPDNASLTRFVADPFTCLAIGTLIVLGGLGFPVLAELAARGRPVTRHARWVVLATIALIAVGAFLLAIFEGYAPLAALFQSITLRTAGFNTVPLGALGLPAVALCVAWMLVGGSPAGTAGGFKTTTGIAAFAAIAGRPTLDRPTARRAARLIAVFLAAFVSFVVVVALAQGEVHRRLVFEVASALGTVGLTMDYTDELGSGARLLICLAMFVGRVGPFALAAAILPWREETLEAPPAEERVLLG